MSRPPTTKWSETRAKRPPNEGAVARHLERFETESRAYRLREIREDLGLTQVELAERLHVTQPSISALESGDLERSGLTTLKAYIAALGGTVEIVADFGDRKLVLSTGK